MFDDAGACAAGLKGRLLVASPALKDEHFSRTVVFMCEHGSQGAMGVVLNRQLKDLTCRDILLQISERRVHLLRNDPVHFGGPIDSRRGLILHSSDYISKNTVGISGDVCVTSSVDILEHIADGKGPKHNIIVLGYAGWKAEQLEREIREQWWFVADADYRLVFGTHDGDEKWRLASIGAGVRPEFFVDAIGAC